MKRLFAIIISVIMLVSFCGCAKKKEASVVSEETAINVRVEKAKNDTITSTAKYMGEVKAAESASISSKASGNAKAVYKEVGDYVNEGETLLIIDDTDYRIQYNQAKAAYNQALAQYNSVTNGSSQQTKIQLESALSAANIELNNAKTNLDNQKVLFDSGAISKSAYDSAVTRYDNAKISYDTAKSNYDLTLNVVLEEGKATAKAALDSASVQMEAAQNALNNTVIKAPISGYIASRSANKGQMVAAGMEIFSIKYTDSINVHINVTESVIPYVKEGAAAIITVDSAKKEQLEGRVTNLSAVKDPQSGMYKVIIAIVNKDNTIKDGMFAEVEIALEESKETLVISSEALMENSDGEKYVYVAVGNQAKRADVTMGIITDEKVEILSGIKEGDKVIVSGKEYISDKNNTIRIVNGKGGK